MLLECTMRNVHWERKAEPKPPPHFPSPPLPTLGGATSKSRPSGWSAGGRPTLKTMKTASRTWKSGRKAAVQSGHGRPARGADSGLENGDYRREPRRETQSCVAWNSRIRARTATPFPSILFMSPSCPPAVRKRFPPLGTHLPATRSGATRLSMKKNVDKTVVRD